MGVGLPNLYKSQVYYSGYVIQSGVFLDLLDLVLLGWAGKKNLLFLALDDQKDRKLNSLNYFIEKMMDFKVAEGFEDSPALDDDTTWVIVASRADWEEGPFLTFNHFMPGWQKERMSIQEWEKCCELFEAQYAARREKIQADIDSLTKFLDSTGETQSGEYVSLLMVQKSLEKEYSALKRCIEIGVYVEPVKADGNCGLWTLLELDADKPMLLSPNRTPPSYEDMMSLRQDSWFVGRCNVLC